MRNRAIIIWIFLAQILVMSGQDESPPRRTLKYYNTVALELSGYPLSLLYARHVVLPDNREIRTFFTVNLPAVIYGFPGLSAGLEMNQDYKKHWSLFFGPRLGICNVAFPIKPVIQPPYPANKNRLWGKSDFYFVSAEVCAGFAYRLGRWGISPFTPGLVFSVASKPGDDDGALYLQAAMVFHSRISFQF